MRWWVFFLALLVVPSASALSITGCPSQVTSGQPFQVTVSQTAAAYVGVDNGTGIADSQTGESAQLTLRVFVITTQNSYKIYGAYKNSGDTTWTYDLANAVCSLKVIPADHPATVPMQGSTHNTFINDQFWIESYEASDADGISKLELYRSTNGITFSKVYPVKYCNSQTTCSNTWYRSENQAGTYTYKVTLTDALSNTYDSQAWSISVTDPCENSGCGVCTDYSWACVSYSGGSLCNPQDPANCYDPDQHCTKSYAQAGVFCTTPSGEHGTCDGAGTCVPDCQPTAELCNGLDDNCDGLVDNQVTDCPGLCVNGQCVGCVQDQDCPEDWWNDTGEVRWVPDGECREKKQARSDHIVYSCYDGSCNSGISEVVWTDTGQARDVTDGSSCSLPDGGSGFCSSGSCVECLSNDDCSDSRVCDNGFCHLVCYGDNDGDGYGAGDIIMSDTCSGLSSNNNDCDDTNSNTHPGADELCNNRDDNCDGTVDEGCECADGDNQSCYSGPESTEGVGVCHSGTQTCEMGLWGDCEGQVLPAEEACNGLDDDCDSEIDEGSCSGGRVCVSEGGSYSCQCPEGTGWNPSTGNCSEIKVWFLDNDGDGYGNYLVTESSPFKPDGFVNNSLDCDDNNAAVFPGNVENCVNGIDDNCDGLVDYDDLISCSEFDCGSQHCAPSVFQVTIVEPEDCRLISRTYEVSNSSPVCNNGLCEYSQSFSLIGEDDAGSLPDNTVCDGGFCLGGSCKPPCSLVPGCYDNVPGGLINDSFGCDSGSCYFCPENTVWNGEACEATPYVIEQDDIVVTAGQDALLSPVVKRNGEVVDANIEFSGFSSSEKISTAYSDVGSHDVTIMAYSKGLFGSKLLASKRVSVVVVCPGGVECCPAGEPRFEDDGVSCDYDGAPGFCNNGLCQPTCKYGATPEDASRNNCDDGLDNDCDGVYDCVVINGRHETGCEDFCSVFCPEGAAVCGSSCSDLSSDRNNCGSCGFQCSPNEQCIDGFCQAVEGCFVACESDSDCGERGFCVNPGSCDAYCSEAPVVNVSKENAEDIAVQILKEKGFIIRKEVDGNRLLITATNVLGAPLSNFRMVVSSPERFSSDHDFETVGDNAVFLFPELGSSETVILLFDHQLSPGFSKLISVSASYDPININSIKPSDDLVITSSFEETSEGTMVRLKLNTDSRLNNVRVPLEIPKCLARSISELSFDKSNYFIVNDDPLMVWTFSSLSGSEEIVFKVHKKVSDSCKDELRAFGIVGSASRPVSPWLPLAAIPIIGVILLFFHQIHSGGAEKHLSKSEFFRLARESGESEESIEKAWLDYKRRF